MAGSPGSEPIVDFTSEACWGHPFVSAFLTATMSWWPALVAADLLRGLGWFNAIPRAAFALAGVLAGAAVGWHHPRWFPQLAARPIGDEVWAWRLIGLMLSVAVAAFAAGILIGLAR